MRNVHVWMEEEGRNQRVQTFLLKMGRIPSTSSSSNGCFAHTEWEEANEEDVLGSSSSPLASVPCLELTICFTKCYKDPAPSCRRERLRRDSSSPGCTFPHSRVHVGQNPSLSVLLDGRCSIPCLFFSSPPSYLSALERSLVYSHPQSKKPSSWGEPFNLQLTGDMGSTGANLHLSWCNFLISPVNMTHGSYLTDRSRFAGSPG